MQTYLISMIRGESKHLNNSLHLSKNGMEMEGVGGHTTIKNAANVYRIKKNQVIT